MIRGQHLGSTRAKQLTVVSPFTAVTGVRIPVAMGATDETRPKLLTNQPPIRETVVDPEQSYRRHRVRDAFVFFSAGLAVRTLVQKIDPWNKMAEEYNKN